MAMYALVNNPALAVKPTKVCRHVEDGGTLEALAGGKFICLECAKVGYLLKAPKS